MTYKSKHRLLRTFFIVSAVLLLFSALFLIPTFGRSLFINKDRSNKHNVTGQTASTVNGTLSDIYKHLSGASVQDNTDRRYVLAGGELIGIRLSTDGIAVIGTEKFENDAGQTVSPAESAGIEAGDIIIRADGEPLTDNAKLTERIRDCGGSAIRLDIRRNDQTFTTMLVPEKTSSTGLYKGGLWIRDSAGGIGTLTYSDTENGTLGALGHGIYDTDTGKLLPAVSGSISGAKLSGVEKGTKGKAGQLCGTASDNEYGTLEVNNDEGIYGELSAVFTGQELYPVARPGEIHTGSAQILCTVTDGTKQYYDIDIEKISSSSDGKDMTIRVTDTTLLSITGGIVQGMSGSPIIQDGMLAGAVTHVFLNDPTSGYGIFAEKMLSQSDAIKEAHADKAA